MALTSPDRIEMNPFQQQRLRHLIRGGTTSQQLVLRARIILLAAAGLANTKIAARVWVCVDTAGKWRHRWWVQPGTASLGDAKRAGRPPSFTPVQVAAVKALACQPPVMPLIENPQCCSSKVPTLVVLQVSGCCWL